MRIGYMCDVRAFASTIPTITDVDVDANVPQTLHTRFGHCPAVFCSMYSISIKTEMWQGSLIFCQFKIVRDRKSGVGLA